MRYKRLKLSALLLLGLGLAGLQAQTAVTITGGNAWGRGDLMSYSVGQDVYLTNTGTNALVAQSVQQPFDILEVTGLEKANGINLIV